MNIEKIKADFANANAEISEVLFVRKLAISHILEGEYLYTELTVFFIKDDGTHANFSVSDRDELGFDHLINQAIEFANSIKK